MKLNEVARKMYFEKEKELEKVKEMPWKEMEKEGLVGWNLKI